MFALFKKKKKPEAPSAIVVPRIKHTNFLKALENIPGMDDNAKPLVEPLAGDLLMTYAVDTGPGYEMVSRASIAKYGLDPADLRTLARSNALPALRSIQCHSDGTLYALRADDNMTACSILFGEFWDQVERERGGQLITIFPHRDRVVFGRLDNPATIPALHKVLESIDFNQPHALSQLMYTRAPGGAWQAMESRA